MSLVRNSDLTKIRNEVDRTVNEVATENELLIWQLLYEEYLGKEEVAKVCEIEICSINTVIHNLRKKVLKEKPFLKGEAAIKYKGAARIINMLAMECERKGFHDTRISYQDIAKNTEDIIDLFGTEHQKRLYRLYFQEGHTQVHIANTLGRIQPTIHKSIFGNFDTRYRKHYGGIINKIGKHLRGREILYCCSLVDTHGKILSYIFNSYKT